MKTTRKLFVSLAFVAALVLAFGLPSGEPVNASPPTCPPIHCPEVLDDYTYLGPCAGGSVCLGWRYAGNGEICHVPALQ